jgi:ABC-type dipeptide/oligopeptide/nickel transport system permease subunit
MTCNLWLGLIILGVGLLIGWVLGYVKGELDTIKRHYP